MRYKLVTKDPRGGHNRVQINQQFFKIWSPPMAYVLGFIFADGAIEDVQKSSRTCYLTITSKDLSILEKIKVVMNSTHRLYKKQSQFITFPGGKNYVSGERFVFRVGSKLMFNDLLKLGVTPRKSLTILLPKVPLKHLSFFIRGYFDGDGCIYLIKGKYPRVIFTSGSLLFLQGLSQILSVVLHIPLKIPYSQLQKSGNLCFHLHYNTRISKTVLELMYKNLDKAPYLERKYTIYQKYIKTQSEPIV